MDGGPLRLSPLGGLGEFGLNALLLEWGDQLLLVDAGMSFATSDTPGVDAILPDFQSLAERRSQAQAILLTHGHEDHIGALPWALEAAPVPVYGSRLTLAFAERRLRERGVHADLRELRPGVPVEIGAFRVHPIHVAHSVVDSLALAIETPAGVVLHSGDFKLDPEAAPGERTDLETLAEWGRRGVLVLLADSTNADVSGRTGGEDDVIPAFEDILDRTPGRVVVACFASSIPRIQRVANLCVRGGRPIVFAGRRMVDNATLALDLGYLRIPAGALVAAADLDEAGTSERPLIFISGSQGEPLSALSLVALGEHRDVAVGPGDTVVFSSRIIPGNERAVSRTMGQLLRQGCNIVHQGNARVHVSGHGNQDDLAELIRCVRPRYLVPIHGEYRMLALHARLAAAVGLAADQILLLEDGDVLSFVAGEARREERIAVGRTLLDRGADAEVDDAVVRDRRHLSSDGVVIPVVIVERHTGQLQSPPHVVTRGLADGEREVELGLEAARAVAAVMDARSEEERRDLDLARERVRMEMKRFFRRRIQKRPLVIPVVMEV